MSVTPFCGDVLTQGEIRWRIPQPLSMPNPLLLKSLARVFLAGQSIAEDIVARAEKLLGRPWRWLRPVTRRYIRAFAGGTRPRQRDVVAFLREDQGVRRAWRRHRRTLKVEAWLNEPQQMQPVEAATAWDIPAIESAGALAEWFGSTHGELNWFADLKALACKSKQTPQLGHYHYRVLSKQSGSIRLIEAPKPRIKHMQRLILSEILEKIPSHSAAHGFIRSRSILTFVAPHVGRRVVLRMDLCEFFPSISGARIQTVFRTAGYPESVADLLGGICTNAVPRGVLAHSLYRRPHLPQGAPTSPALANICTYRMDCRLAGLAKAAGADYTRYADDLAFSGGESFENVVKTFSLHVAAVAMEENFSVNHRKTRVMRQGVRQHLAGLVINSRVNIRRADFDRLKATLTNCIRSGPHTQNRENHQNFRQHLEGKVAFVEMVNQARGNRLRQLLNQIVWP